MSALAQLLQWRKWIYVHPKIIDFDFKAIERCRFDQITKKPGAVDAESLHTPQNKICIFRTQNV